MEYKYIDGSVTAPIGFMAAGVHCGIRKNKDKKDLALIYSEKPCAAAAVYTQNLVKGAPVVVTKYNINHGRAQAVICNSGNANTCNADGIEKAKEMCKIVADPLGIIPEDVIVASTGVIGQPLDIEPIRKAVPDMIKCLSAQGASDAAEAIMTTDTVKKELAVEFTISGKTCRIGAIAKGSGMIHPNMATMLCFITTDTDIHPELLDRALHDAVNVSFNMLSVDGDTSTNDMVSIMASGTAQNKKINDFGDGYIAFSTALTALCTEMVKMMAKDGEGATKLVMCKVSGATTEETARKAAKAVICSNLVKTAMFGSDANWGRILCALGYSQANITINKVDVALSSSAGEIKVCKDGAGIEFSEEQAKKILLEDEILIDVTLHDGPYSATAYGCDLTYDYVKINGDYRT